MNPAHLELVPLKINYLRGVGTPADNARKTHCKRGHPLSGDNLRMGTQFGLPKRVCRQCVRDREERERRQKGIPKRDYSVYCKAGHLWTPENTYYAPNDTRRNCRTCCVNRKRQYTQQRLNEP